MLLSLFTSGLKMSVGLDDRSWFPPLRLALLSMLATEVQLDDPTDRDQLRFALTGEGGLNDGTAVPVVMLGLDLLGAHEIGAG